MNFAFTLVHWGIFQQQNIFGSQLAKCCKANTNFKISCLEDTECFPQEDGQIMFLKPLFFSTFIYSDIVFQPRGSVDNLFQKKKKNCFIISYFCFVSESSSFCIHHSSCNPTDFAKPLTISLFFLGEFGRAVRLFLVPSHKPVEFYIF